MSRQPNRFTNLVRRAFSATDEINELDISTSKGRQYNQEEMQQQVLRKKENTFLGLIRHYVAEQPSSSLRNPRISRETENNNLRQ